MSRNWCSIAKRSPLSSFIHPFPILQAVELFRKAAVLIKLSYLSSATRFCIKINSKLEQRCL